MQDTPYIKPLLNQNRPIWIMGVHDVLSAKIAEKAGYDAVGVQSLQMGFVNGQPDTGVITPTELLDTVRKIRRSISLPIMVDFEQGFGDVYAAVYWLHEFERAGAAALAVLRDAPSVVVNAPSTTRRPTSPRCGSASAAAQKPQDSRAQSGSCQNDTNRCGERSCSASRQAPSMRSPEPVAASRGRRTSATPPRAST